MARVGKDTFAKCLSTLFAEAGIKCENVAFAESLKKDLKKFLLAKSGVNPYSEEGTEKKLLRPLMVEYGRLMRELTAGQYWIEQITKKVEKNTNNNIISLITDVRYANEASWVNSHQSGTTIHLERNGIEPANQEEEIHDPQTKELCEYSIHWRNCPTALQLNHQVEKYFNVFELSSKFIRPRSDKQNQGSRQARPLPARISK